MGRTARMAVTRIAIALSFPFAIGCAGMGLGNVLDGIPLGGDVRGRVEWVDARSREIGISSSRGSRETVRYDSRTRVVYRDRVYDVRDLERGDVVSIDVDQDSRGRRYARTVRVERDVRSSDGRGGGRVQRFEGRVAWVDTRRGQFGMEAGRGRSYVVTIPDRTSNSTLNRFRKLRRGDRVRFEGEAFREGRVQLDRFV